MPVVRQARASDIPALLELQTACYPTLAAVSAWTEHHLRSHQRNFPEGQLVAEVEGRIVGFSASFIVQSATALRAHSFRDITHRGSFDGHDPTGDALYGAEIMVHPDQRRRGIGSLLYEARYALIRRLGLRYFVAGGRLPGFGDVADETSVEHYLSDVIAGRRTDRVLTPQLRNGMSVKGLLPNYLNDPKSRNYASLLVWENPDWQPHRMVVKQAYLARARSRTGEWAIGA